MSDTFARDLEAFTASYIRTLLWSSTIGDDAGTPLDSRYDDTHIVADSMRRIQADCFAFHMECGEHYTDPGRAGHDFWLTRNGHGAGFWDGDYPEPQATRLTNASKRFGECDAVVSRGRIYVEPSPQLAAYHARRLNSAAFDKGA